jgi:uncharacterized protein involved in exopolysaccharide biosynthesis
LVIFWVTLIIFVCAILIAFFWPPTYSATGSVLVKSKKVEKSPEALERELIRPFKLTREDLVSEEHILSSIDVIEKAIYYLQSENFYVKGEKTEDFFKNEVRKVKKNLKTEIIPASNIIEITFYHKSPDDASTVLKALMKQYIVHREQIHNPSQEELFFAHQVREFKDGLKKKEDELKGMIDKNEISDPQKELENNLLVKVDLEQQLNILKTNAIEKKLHIEYLERTLKNENIHFFSSVDNPTITGLNGLSPKLQDLIAERRNILRIYHPSSEKAQAIEEQIENTYLSLKSEVEEYKEDQLQQLQILNEKINYIENKLNTIDKINVELRKHHIDSKRIEAESDLLLFSYETFFKRREEAKIKNSIEATNFSSHVAILSKAYSPESPVFPKKVVIIPLGLIIGFITGCSLGFLREYFDHTFKKPGDIETYTGLPVILSIPK